MPKVLVVDDAQFMRMRCSRLLLEGGFEVVEAENGAEAVRVYEAQRPDVVLMDITMPEMDGLSALREIRRQDPDARIAMLTALGQQGIVLEAIKSGARDFIVKPFNPERMLNAVRKLLT